MNTITVILNRMINEPAFAEALIATPEKALAEYNLPADEIAQFKGLSQADFEALASQAPEERRSLATASNNSGHMIVGVDRVEITR